MGHQETPTPVATENTEANRIFDENKNILSNRHDILLGQRQNTTKPFPNILGIGKEKPCRLCHKTQPDMAPWINEIQICQSKKKKPKRPVSWDQERVCWNYQSQENTET